MSKCPISGFESNIYQDHGGSQIYYVENDLVGKYTISRTASTMAENLDEEERSKLVMVLRGNFENNIETQITSDNLKKLPNSIEPSFDPIERINRIIIYVFKKLKNPADDVQYDPKTDYPIAHAKDQNEFAHYLSLASKLGYIDCDSSTIRPTLEGWKYYNELKKTQSFTNQAFVAMWFDSDLDEVWEKGFKKGLEDTDYDPMRIDIAEHNDKICDRINIEIRKSSLVVADFTGNRGGVYFEAGFAMGLDIPVIWTCRNDFIDRLHFDTRQYNHIVWDSFEDLREKLSTRIRATIPGKLHTKDT
ncbi:hypothetical protein [Fodinibius salsisoli]|uniref:Nucleoside 2-deoxyribosyltransferase n=1 Tax=Fodinibius salsisoli TaxID=2820877 RepID=A0ABT3PIN8_9BACT|nr:hypothetical protein [Fodinibius salsisoli]MCW9705782.1 hypothetical protein [Fodinibius salsisoli]